MNFFICSNKQKLQQISDLSHSFTRSDKITRKISEKINRTFDFIGISSKKIGYEVSKNIINRHQKKNDH